jgi:hypothetical protein
MKIYLQLLNSSHLILEEEENENGRKTPPRMLIPKPLYVYKQPSRIKRQFAMNSDTRRRLLI